VAPLMMVGGKRVDGAQVADWIGSALESGSAYWCADLKPTAEFSNIYRPRARFWYADGPLWCHPKLAVRFAQRDAMEHSGARTGRHLQQAVYRLAENRRRTLARLLDEPGVWDATDADVFLQMFLMGERIYV
jgi:hypothetical protein